MSVDIRGRIKKRIEVCGLNMKVLDEALGLGTGFIFDFISGRKKTLSDDVIRGLATHLKTTEIWLLRGVGPEEPSAQPVMPPSGPASWASAHEKDIERVLPKERKTVVFTGMDFITGSVSILDHGSSLPPIPAVVLDPEIMIPGNAYAEAFSKRQPIRVVMKRVVMRDGKEMWVILDLA